MNRAFGMGDAQAAELIRTDPGARRIYDCALLALVTQEEELSHG